MFTPFTPFAAFPFTGLKKFQSKIGRGEFCRRGARGSEFGRWFEIALFVSGSVEIAVFFEG